MGGAPVLRPPPALTGPRRLMLRARGSYHPGMLPFAGLPLLLGLLAGSGGFQESQPSLSTRISELRAALKDIAEQLEKVRSGAGPLPQAPAGRAAPPRPSDLPPEKEVELLEGIVGDLRASLRNLETDLRFREARTRLAEDLATRKPAYGSVKLADQPPRPVPPAPPKPVEPAPPAPGPAISDAAVPAPPPTVERTAPQLPPEALTGGDRVVLRVNGAEVRKRDVDELVAYQKSYSSGPEGLLIRDALERALLPIQIARAAYGDRVESLKTKAEKLRSDLASGKDFAELARANSDDRTTAANGGDLGLFGREDFKLPFARAAFGTEAGKVSSPFWTSFGLNLLQVDEVLKGEKPSLDRVRGRYILLAFDPKDPNFYQTLNRLTDEAKVEVVDPSYRNAVPPRYLRER
jgi:PPIC-type peptidyl-prolyl cis-trans isomerase-like protein